MLVLNRHEQQAITIRNAAGELLATVQVVEIKGGSVRLGFIANPRELVIDRMEVDDDKHRQRRASA